MPLYMRELSAFLRAGGMSAQVVYDGRPWAEVPMPDLAVQLNPRGGSGFFDERAFDRQGVQIECRSGQNDPSSGEILAWQIDEILCGITYPVDMTAEGETSTVHLIDRKAPPALAMWDPGSRRSFFVATYLFDVPSPRKDPDA